MSTPDWRIASDGQQARIAPDGVTEVVGPAWTGRFERMTFGPGFHMHLGRLDVASDTEHHVAAQDDGPTPISVYAMISGKAVLSMDGWPDLRLRPGQAILFTAEKRRSVFRLPGQQVLRFFSVAMSPELFVTLFDGRPPPALSALIESRGRVTVVHERTLGAGTRSLIAALGSPRATGALHRLQREAAAIQMLTEMLEPQLAEPLVAVALTRPEEAAVRAARGKLVADLRDAPSAAVLAADAGIGLRRFLRAFERLHGESPAQALRAERLNQARQMLEAGELSLKEVAWRVGYNHVSNFVTAFADHFGLPPRQYLRQA
ncbi:MAG: AraC family transcriptional regulator [Phenylobacterium sp.]